MWYTNLSSHFGWVTSRKDLIIKPTRCTNFSNLYLSCFGQFLCPSSGVFHCTHNNGICHTGLLTACEQDQNVPLWSYSQAVSKPVWHIPLLCVQWKTPDDVQRNCPKHVEFHSKNKFEKLVHLVGFIIRNLTQCTVTWTSNSPKAFPPHKGFMGILLFFGLFVIEVTTWHVVATCFCRFLRCVTYSVAKLFTLYWRTVFLYVNDDLKWSILLLFAFVMVGVG